MNAQKFTQKSLEAIQRAQDIALNHGNVQIEQAHLLDALVTQENGLIPQLLTRMGVDAQMFAREADALVAGLPAVSGSGREPGKVYVSQEVDRNLNDAESEAASMKDDYVSVEHIFLTILSRPNSGVRRLLESHNIHKDGFLTALAAVRGNQRVTSDSP